MLRLLLIISILQTSTLTAQDTTNVVLDLTNLESKTVAVEVYPPTEQKEWEYVIPEIVPGTYMKVRYERFYKKVKAFDKDGNRLKLQRKKNIVKIKGKQPLHKITYIVEPTLGDGKVWDNTLVCGGSAYTSGSALINFQMVNGYFEGFEKAAFKIEVTKPHEFYGASSIEKLSSGNETDILSAPNYNELIDQPILYAKADTTSFQIKENTFRIAVFAEAGNIKAQLLKPRFEAIMHGIDTFSGFTTDSDYHFLLYFADKENLKGLFKTFGSGSALEHKNSSVYYGMDKVFDSTFSYYNWVGPHEYFHTITPLNLHSEKIANFNYRESDMSAHVWMYEGITDYLAFLLNAQASNLKRSNAQDMAYAAQSAINRDKQSMTESAKDIIARRNMVSWIRKVFDIMNYYEKGKIIALSMDWELMERTNGEKRLLDVMLEMQKDYEGSYFDDDSLLSILESYTYEGFKEQFAPYIEGTENPPFEEYFEKLGWTFYPKNSIIPTYGIYLFKDREADRYYIGSAKKKNALGLKEGDTVISINNQPLKEYFNKAEKGSYYHEVAYPQVSDSLKMTVKRDGEIIEVEGSPKLEKVKYEKMKINYYRFTEEQKKYRAMFFEEEKWKR